MKVGLALTKLLRENSAVAAIVGTRIFPELAPQGQAAPYIVYSVISNQPSHSKQGVNVDEAQLELFCVGNNYGASNDLADKVRDALSRENQTYTGALGNVDIESIQYMNEVVQVSEKRDLFVNIQDYTIRIRR